VDAVIAGNRYLADWYRQHNERVYVLPTAVDTNVYRPISDEARVRRSVCTIGWMGTSGNFPHLELARSAVEAVAQGRDDVRVLIVSDRRPDGWKFDDKRFTFREWSEITEVSDLQDMDVGLMPLQSSAWTRGKCSFKMLQYLAVGIPVVVTPVGMNKEVLSGADVGFAASDENGWLSALAALCDDETLRRRMGNSGRQLVEKVYSTKIVGGEFASILRNVSSLGAAEKRLGDSG
jgi:glycosyltransferase involved in cell wall biosynthesis